MSKKEIKVAAKKPVAKPKAAENKVDAFVVKKYTLLKIGDWLANVIIAPGSENERKYPLALHGSEARARNKVRKIILERADQVEDERIALVEKYAKKGEDGKAVLDPKTDRYEIEDRENFNKEFLELMSETTSFDILPSNRAEFMIVKDIFINRMKSEMTVDDTNVYEEVCQAFEAI
jgi:hypothetical protein